MIKEAINKEKSFFYVAPLFIWQLLFFYLPLILMIAMSFKSQDAFYFYKPFLNLTYLIIIVKSLALAALTGVLCFMVGYPLAYFLAFQTGRFKLLFLFLLILPFWTNFLLHVYAWFFILDRNGVINMALQAIGLIREPLDFLNSMTGIIILMLYCYLPFMTLPIYASLEHFDRTLFAASSDLGATRWQTWYHVVLPLSMSGVISGFVLVFIPSFGEFAIPSLMGGERYIFVGSVIAQFALGHGTLEYATSFTVMSFIMLVISAIAGFLLMRAVKGKYGS